MSLPPDIVDLPSGHTVHLDLSSPSLPNESDTKLAVLLHPWSWLGGSMNDPVLQFLARPLHERGFHVLRYNSRGVGRSKGWPSLTGSQDAADLREIVQWALEKVSNVRHLLFVGYSHGSLIASQHLPLSSPTLQTSHILLSYPLGPRAFLTFFHSKSYSSALSSLVRDPASHVLILYGDHDEFTGAESYHEWAAQLLEQGQENPGDAQGRGRVAVSCIEGGRHFWGMSKADEMFSVIERWLNEQGL